MNSFRENNTHCDSAALLGASLGWAALPDVVKSDSLMPSISDRPVALTAMSDAATAAAAVAYG